MRSLAAVRSLIGLDVGQEELALPLYPGPVLAEAGTGGVNDESVGDRDRPQPLSRHVHTTRVHADVVAGAVGCDSRCLPHG